MLGLPGVAEFSNCLCLALGDEHRVVAEALAASAFRRHRPLQRPRASNLLALGREANELAHVLRPPVLDPLQLTQQPVDAAPGFPPAGGVDARPPAERHRLDTRVLAEDPLAGPRFQPMARLRERVLVVRRSVFLDVVRKERDRPVRRRGCQLLPLVLLGGDEERYAAHSTPTAASCARVTCSIPAEARSSSVSRLSRVNGSRSAVACTSISRPSPTSTTFRSTSAVESSE